MKKLLMTQEEVSNLKERLKNPTPERVSTTDFVSRMRSRQREEFQVISTGLQSVDASIGGGLYPKTLTTIVACSSIGKTTLLLQMATTIARSGRRVLFFTLENHPDQNSVKMVSSITDEIAEIYKMQKGGISAEEINNIEMFEALTPSRQQLFYDALDDYEKIDSLRQAYQPGSYTLDQIIDEIIADVLETGEPPVIMIDFLQCILGDKPSDSEKAIVDKSMRKLKMIAVEFKVPVVCLSSIPRSYYHKDLELDSGKESGDIEFRSDIVFGLQMPPIDGELTSKMIKYYKKQDLRNLELKLLKNRNGKSDEIRIPLTLKGATSRILEGHLGQSYDQSSGSPFPIDAPKPKASFKSKF